MSFEPIHRFLIFIKLAEMCHRDKPNMFEGSGLDPIYKVTEPTVYFLLNLRIYHWNKLKKWLYFVDLD